MKPLDLTKPLQTRNGLSARIGFTDLQDALPVVAAVKSKAGREVIYYYRLDGTGASHQTNDLDLINVPEKETMIKLFTKPTGSDKSDLAWAVRILAGAYRREKQITKKLRKQIKFGGYDGDADTRLIRELTVQRFSELDI